MRQRRPPTSPLLPEHSEDTDAGWGEYTEPDDDERLRLDWRPAAAYSLGGFSR